MAKVTVNSQRSGGLGDYYSQPDFIKEIQNASREDLKKTAALVIEEQSSDSNVFDTTMEAKIPEFDFTEIRLGRTIGRGGFCVVSDIEKVKIAGDGSTGSSASLFSRMKQTRSHGSFETSSERGDTDKDFEQYERKSVTSEFRDDFGGLNKLSRKGVASISRKKSRGKRRQFALKRVSSELASADKFSYLKGLVDLSVEAKFLAVMDHPNIISLCGVSKEGFSDFIIIERLRETLSARFRTWMKIDRQCKGITGAFTGSKNKKSSLYEERIKTSYDIAWGVEYLHSRKIVFRDLKPDNIGFDGNDNVKIFDFGLAKELKDNQRTEDGLYKMTGFTGAVRYMAPEVGLGMPYNLSVDVYSWSMIMWFILALEPPFGFYTEDMIVDRVFKRGSRPALFDSWSKPLGNLMKRAWDNNISERPPFSEICSTLRLQMVESDTTLTTGSTSSD